MLRLPAALLAFVAVMPAAAQMPPAPGGPAAIGEWIEAEGARVRVLLDAADPAGRVEGVVEIDLEPGWKTYWIAPGPFGIAPSFDARGSDNVMLADVDHPAPRAFEEAYGTSIGYTDDVGFPLDLVLTDPTAPARLRLNGFLGVCAEICVPLPLSVEGDVVRGRSLPLAETLPIARARMALPLRAEADGIAATARDGEIVVTGLPDAEAFVAPPPGLSLGEGTMADGTWRAAIRATIRAGEPSGALTVVTRDGAIETVRIVPIEG